MGLRRTSSPSYDPGINAGKERRFLTAFLPPDTFSPLTFPPSWPVSFGLSVLQPFCAAWAVTVVLAVTVSTGLQPPWTPSQFAPSACFMA